MLFSTLAASLVALSASDPMPKGPAPVVVELDQPRAVTEYFLVSEADRVGVATDPVPIAVVALRSIDRSAAGQDEFLLEREVIFATGGLRIRHTETGHGASRRLVWREFLPAASRTWVADWTFGERGAPVRSIAYGWNRPVHERVMTSMETERPVYGPLELLFGARQGALACGDAGGAVGVIDPSAAAVVECYRSEAVTAGLDANSSALDVRRSDGTLVLGADFSPATATSPGTFTAIRLSDRSTAAKRIERKEFDRLKRRWTVESRRPYDAILAQIPDRR